MLRSAYQQWADKELISWETVRGIQAVEAPPVKKNNTPALTEDQAIWLLQAIPLDTAKGIRDFAMVNVYFVTACRASAIINARVGDLEESVGEWFIHVTEKRKADARKNLLHAAGPLLAYMDLAGIGDDMEGPLFRPMTVDGLGFERRQMDRKLPWRLVKHYCREAGISPDRPKGPGIGIHSLRKTAANNAKENGAGVHEIQELLGHKSIMTTEAYFETNEQDGENAARRIKICVPFDRKTCASAA